MKNDDEQSGLILAVIGIIPVIWFALLVAPYLSSGLMGILDGVPEAMNHPFSVQLCGDSEKTVLIFLLSYGMGIGIYLSTKKHYRRGEEHGSAKWGNVKKINRRYREKRFTKNKLLTMHVRISYNMRKHMRNLLTVVIGGSGSGKTRFFAKVNLLQANTSFVVLDPKGENLRDTGYLLEEKGYGIDEEGFQAAMEKQRVQAREARKETNYMGADATVYDEIDPSVTTEFVGYDTLSCDSKITVLTTESEITEAVADGQRATIFVEKTPFYATMGGQEGDTGIIHTADAEFAVEETIKLLGGKFGHIGRVTKGMFRTGDTVTLEVRSKERLNTCKNHSATHLLQKALKTVLGSHVEQKGSLVTPDRLRFDFAHFSAMTKEEIEAVEALVNEEIAKNNPVVTEVMNVEEAKKTGAMALFGEKYEEDVRVVTMGDFSKELCGGTHVSNTGLITTFKIVSESGVAAGVRRIEALTGDGVFAYYKAQEQKLAEAAKLLKATPENLAEKISHLLAETKSLHSEIESLKSKAAQEAVGDVMNQVEEICGVKVLAVRVEDVDMGGLRELGDQLKEKLGEGVVVIASAAGGKVSLMATATEGALKKGAHAGNLIKAIAGLVGGGGGGRPNMAQAGGKNPEGIDAALSKAKEVLAEQIQ